MGCRRFLAGGSGAVMSSEIETVLDQCLEAAANPVLWPVTLARLAKVMGSRGVLVTRPARNHFGILYPSSMEDAIGLFFEESWHMRDLRSERTIERGPDLLTADQHIVSPDEVNRSDYYNGFARRADVPWFTAFGIAAPGEAMVGISFQRRQAEGAFSNSDLEAIVRMAPRLRQALTLSSAMADGHNDGQMQGLGLVDQAALLLADDGALLAANAAAEALIGTGLRRSGRGIAAVHPASRLKLERYITAACCAGAEAARLTATPLALPCADGGVLMVQAAPVIGSANEVFGAGRTLLLLSQVGQPRMPSIQTLIEAFGLTQTEGRVAAVLAQGLPVKLIAEQMAMSEAAVRFHIKSILPKAQMRSAAQFAAAASRLT
jgi:DNA-binding CsgD family transcriptional regulator